MLPLVFAGIVFLFLLLGAIVFLLCVLLPPARKYALSAALWFAMWGPCTIAWMIIAGIGLFAAAFISQAGDSQILHSPRLLSTFGWGYLTAGVLGTILVASISAWIHQAIIRRLTFALFRLYASAISAGIGSVFGWCVGWWMTFAQVHGYVWLFLWALSMMALITSFGISAYKGARSLRGEMPKRFSWLSPEDYAAR